MQYVKDFLKYVKDYSKYVDFTIIITYVLLSLIGLIMIYSASMVNLYQNPNSGNPMALFNGQFRFVILGFLLVFFMTYFMSGEFFKNKRLHVILIAVIFIVLLITHFFGIERNGERNWLQIPIINQELQPSEFFKIIVILYLAYIYDKKREVVGTLRKENFFPLLLIGVISLLVLFNDFGTWLVIFAIIVGMFVYSGLPMKIVLVVGGFVGLVISVILAGRFLISGEVVSGYQRARIETFMNPFLDPTGSGYQLTNSLISISHGGLTGTGLGNGVMKLGYLPEPHTDFIFAVIAEELGLIGVLFILALYIILVFKALHYASISSDKFYSLVCIGIAMYISIQVFVNIGGISKLIPLTGVPLPLLSQGGSAFLSISIAVGLLSIAAKHVKEGHKKVK
ncbi:FtsW/RodA/SpoVE family cell cycle protein [Corticicoccus populi]|uniref:Probable peptidoglycan glycosyltransferase FtsW n=1 Tax=Corticicoccus populi TaxID=1812821 RepID=A0ABW5WSR2_9STAP